MPAVSSMIKLHKEIERVKKYPFFSSVSPLFSCDSSLIYEGGGWSTFYGKWVIGFRNGKGGGGGSASFAC